MKSEMQLFKFMPNESLFNDASISSLYTVDFPKFSYHVMMPDLILVIVYIYIIARGNAVFGNFLVDLRLKCKDI